jgi:hypothetical protein
MTPDPADKLKAPLLPRGFELPEEEEPEAAVVGLPELPEPPEPVAAGLDEPVAVEPEPVAVMVKEPTLKPSSSQP